MLVMRTLTGALVTGIAFMLMASCGDLDVREPEVDPEGDRPPESQLMSAPYIEPVCECVYIPIDPAKHRKVKW